ncbi:hypothetical protein JXA80_14750 [bacterium]|nr:hypothetical protein [candidate division CSSED10-310 bacterium]
MKINGLSRSIPMIMCGSVLLAGLTANGTVIQTKNWTRTTDPVVVTIADVPSVLGQSIAEYYLWTVTDGVWEQVVFQVDEMALNPGWEGYTPNPFYNYFIWDDIDNGPDALAGDGLFSEHDELVFMADALGDQVTADDWPATVPVTWARIELAFTDPMYPTDQGWVYLFHDDTSPAWTTSDWVDWVDTIGMEKTVDAHGYRVAYIGSGPDDWTHSPTLDHLSISAANGGDEIDLLDAHKNTANIRVYIFNLPFCQSDTAIETYFEDELTYRPHWVWGVKDGPVRVIRQYRMRGQVNGSQWGYHPYYTAKSYKYSMHVNERFYINTSMPWNWGETSFDHEETALPLTYRDETGNTGIIDGINTNDTVIPGDVPDWVLVTSVHGSYHVSMDVTSVQATSTTSVWNDDGPSATEAGTCQNANGRFGDFGYRWTAPVLQQNTWLNWYFTFLPNTVPDTAAMGDELYDRATAAIPPPAVQEQPFVMPSPTPTPECIHHGDVDFNGSLSATDAQIAFCITMGLVIPTYQESCAADCDGSGSITAADAQQIFLTVIGAASGCVDPM